MIATKSRGAFWARPEDLSPQAIKNSVGIQIDDLKKLKSYTIGKNYEIMKKEKPSKKTVRDPGSRGAIPYGEKITRTVFGYLFTKDWEQTTAEDADGADYVTALDPDRINISKANRDILIYGYGRLLVYGKKGQTNVTRLDPLKTFEYYDITTGDLMCVAIVTETDGVTIVEQWTQTEYIRSLVGANGAVPYRTPHGVGRIPVAIMELEDRRGLFEAALPAIDFHDTLINMSMDEIQRWAFSILVTTGKKLAGDALDMEAGSVRVFHMDQPGQDVKWLTKQVAVDLWRETVDRVRNLIHDITDVPNFNDPLFSAQSGVALEYKLIGLETVCGVVEKVAEGGIIEAAGIKLAYDTGKYMRPAVTLRFPRLKPLDEAYLVQVGQGMKAAGLSADAVTNKLKALLPGTVADELARQQEQTATEWAALEAKLTPAAGTKSEGQQPDGQATVGQIGAAIAS